MKVFVKTALIVVSLLLSAGLGLAAEPNAPVPDMKGTVKAVGAGVKADAKAVGTGVKTDAKAATATVKQDTKGKAADAKTTVKAKIADINTATEGELKSVPGIGEAYAAKIIAGRPYANKAQLKSRNILPVSVYEQVKELIIAKQAKK